MRRFSCPQCSARVFFDDQTCLNCRTEVAYNPGTDEMGLALNTCSHRFDWLCNWAATDGSSQCASCALDKTVDGRIDQVTQFQVAKRRVYRQLRLIDVDPDFADPPLRFDLRQGTADSPVTIGHADGLVTLDTAEADPSRREEVRTKLGEPYRTPLGHVRHETGHWHWQAYVFSDRMRLDQFRELFGDERVDYAAALRGHYDGIDDGSWRDTYLSYYATAHPWEDYAESFAHVLHMSDMVETAVAEGFITGEFRSLTDIVERWQPLTVSLNEMARSMGTPEPYPFAPSSTALRKMMFVFDVINSSRGARRASS
ncbi:MAG: putative zinc-binding metallopeptidase [Candidatus Nanopelagicales bacterium]